MLRGSTSVAHARWTSNPSHPGGGSTAPLVAAAEPATGGAASHGRWCVRESPLARLRAGACAPFTSGDGSSRGPAFTTESGRREGERLLGGSEEGAPQPRLLRPAPRDAG